MILCMPALGRETVTPLRRAARSGRRNRSNLTAKNGWPRRWGFARDDGAIGTQEEPAIFRRNNRVYSVLRDSGRAKRKGVMCLQEVKLLGR
jgi:hypothetical protein